MKPPLRRRLLVRPLLPLVPKVFHRPQAMRRSQFAVLGAPEGHVVFLGDSITEFGLWHEWFPDTPVLNRGIGAETSAQVLHRLDSAINRPAAVFLLAGTNDLTMLVDVPTIAATIGSIIEEIERRAARTPVFVQSVMPRALGFRDEVLELNRLIRDVVETASPSAQYVDLWPALATSDGRLDTAYSLDKLHLNGEGYRAWAQVLEPLVRKAYGDYVAKP